MCYLRESLRDSIFEPIAENAIKQFKARSMTVRDTKKPWSPEFVVGRALAVAARNHAYADFKRIMVWRNYKEFESRAVEFGIKGERNDARFSKQPRPPRSARPMGAHGAPHRRARCRRGF